MTVSPPLTFQNRLVPQKLDFLAKRELAENAVDLWIAQPSKLVPLDDWTVPLTQEERTRARRYRFEEDQNRYLCGRGMLRALAGAYLGVDPGALQFVYSEAGKPELAHDSQPKDKQPLCFNLSHSGDYVLLGFAWGRAIGVDVELMRQDIEAEQIATRFFSQQEQRDLLSLDPMARIPAFFRCWTRKEAYVKATGEGLGLPLSQFDVAFLPGQPAALLATRPDPGEASRWELRDIGLDPAYATAVIVESVSARP